MRGKLLLHAFLAWLAIAVAAILNGILRQAVLIPTLGDPLAQVLSILLLLAIIVGISAYFVRRPGRDLQPSSLLLVGLAWAAGAVLFEFALGRLVLDVPWSELLAAYDVRTGALWPLAPLAMIAAPPLLGRRRGTAEARSRPQRHRH